MSEASHASGVARPGRQRAWLAALVLWVAFVWGHSLVSGPHSSSESRFFVELLRPVFALAGVSDPDLMSFVVRKCAHFSEYTILGAIAWGNVRAWRERAGRRSRAFLALSAFVPFVDEAIQLLVPGRAGMFRDVLIDLSGLAVGVLVARVVTRGRDASREPSGGGRRACLGSVGRCPSNEKRSRMFRYGKCSRSQASRGIPSR